MEKRQLIGLFLYAVLPIIQFIIYYWFKFSNMSFREIVYLLILANGFSVAYVSNC